MKIKILPYIFFLAFIIFKVFPSFGQLTGIKTVPGDYSSISSAVIALNSSGVGTGGVTFNIAANYTETIAATISLTATGTASDPVVFQKDPGTTGANPLITAYAGGSGVPSSSLQDGIWRLIGSDYVTIDGIDLTDNPANTTNPSTMEYGYALYKAGTSNGCQNNTIKNCAITLNNINNAAGSGPMTDGSTGIIVTNALYSTATTAIVPIAGGSNANNKFYSNTIQNCNTGIGLIGYVAPSPFTLADTNNDVGGNDVSTGNTIINYGGAAGATMAAAAILTLAQYGLKVSYNIINNNNGGGTNHATTLRGIYVNAATSASATISYNTVTVKGGGTTQAVAGIENASGTTPAGNTINISNNTITNSTYATATTGPFYGIINNTSTPSILIINSNTISNNSSAATTTGVFYGILNTGLATVVTINSNALTGNSTGISTGLFAGIYNSASAPRVTINNNTFAGNTTSTVTGLHIPIYNTGTVTIALNIDSNNIGTSLLPAAIFTAANSGGQLFIYNYKGGVAATLSISNNNFYNISYAYVTGGTGSNTYIYNTAATLSQSINNNTFINLNVNTSGSITFISNSVAVAGTGTQNVNRNSISGTFTKAAGGTITLFTSGAASLTGSGINNNDNNFSNITVTGSTIIAGWVNTDAGASTKTIQNNTFNNWAGGSGAITAMNINLTGAGNTITGNAINNISSAGTITGITTSAGNDKIYSNIINTLVSTGTAGTIVSGISVTGGATQNIYQNTIYGLVGSNLTTGSVRGIVITGGTAVNAYQNTIYGLQANAITTGTLSGIWIAGGTTVTVNNNKIYDLSSASSGLITYGIVYGIQVSGNTANATYTLHNNSIGDLRTPAANTTESIRGIGVMATGVTSNINVYFNTIYINASSTGATFGTSGIYQTTSTTATTATLSLRNNIISNTSTPSVAGLTVAYRRSSSTLTNYSPGSNNNLFYAGLPAANRLIFYDATNSDQFIAAYKTRVATRDAQSVTEDLISKSKFLSTSGATSSFLHLDSTQTTQAESGAGNITGFTTDIDGQIRQGNAGYAGTGTAPDIGADELEGMPYIFSGTYNVGAGEVFTSLTKVGGLFAAINSVGLSGNIVVHITSDLSEDGTNPLYQWTEKGVGNYTATIQPDGATVRTISGNVLAGLIRFNGADRVIIDGSYSGSGNYLTFRNTNSAGTTGTAFTFINGATNNAIKYCTVEAYANATNGVILFSTSTVAGGNSTNQVSNCKINATVSSNTGNLCIYSLGTAGKENSTNSIANNSIYNYRDRGLDITAAGSTGWIISGNSFYNGDVTGAINYAISSTLHGIRIMGGSGYSILHNYIGGNAPLATGTNAVYASTLGIISYQGILLTTSNAIPASNIKGNTIAKISVAAVPTSTTAPNLFIGIETNFSGINIGGSLPGDGNTIGSNTANGSIVITTTTALATYITNIRGINCASTGGVVLGNQVGGIDIQNTGAGPGASAFLGIYFSNPTAPAKVNNNIVGSTGTGAASNSIRVLSTSTATATSLTGIYIGSLVASPVQVNGNIIKNMSHQSTTATGTLRGILNSAAAAANITIMNDTITGNSISATAGTIYGIYNTAVSASVAITNNTISGNTAGGASTFYGTYNTASLPVLTISNNLYTGNTTAGLFYGIYNTSTPASLTIANNTFSANSATGNSAFYTIINSGAMPALSITGNLITGNTTAQTSGLFYAIYNSGAVTGTININSNNIGNSTAGPVIFNAANSGSQVFISNTGGAAAAALSISNNNFQNITYNIAGTGTNTYILNSAATFSQAINGNTFTNLNANTSNSVTFISNNVIVPSTGTQNVNNNSIITGFTKKAGGTVTLFTSSSNSAANSVINNNNNNFSNITVTGATTIAGWVNTDGGTGTKTIQNNTFSNWSGGTSGITVMSVNISGAGNATTGNLINSITNGGAITGILTAVGNDNIYSNTINTLSTTATSVSGISVTAGTTKNIYKNKIYDLSSSSATGTVNGILISGSTVLTVNVYNNLIGDLRTPAASAADPVRGISVISTTASSANNIYFNTIYLNASSTGTNFGSSGIYHTVSATATTATLNLRNNSITNMSTPRGTGKTVAYRRSGAALTNYASTSNNNLFYAGVPSLTKVIFYDGTNFDSTLVLYKTRVSTKDSLSVTENITALFSSVSGSSPIFLHINTGSTTQVESGAVNITGFTDDVDGQIRAGNPGYIGSTSSPDIGADEIFGLETTPPSVNYTLLSDTTSTANRNVTGITITDASGVNVAAGTKPRIYYKRYTDANTWLDNTAGTNGWKYTEATNSTTPFIFTIDYSLLNGGASATAGGIQYFIVAQDIATTANIAINSGTFAVAPTSVALKAPAFPIGGIINSYKIPFSGSYNVGNGEVFTSLTKADGFFAAINSAGLMANTNIIVTSDLLEDGAIALNQWPESGVGNYSLTIQPDAATLRTISGNVAGGLIRLDGADRVTIDGSNSGSGSYLSFKNTNTAGTTGTAFTFINGATNNTIRYCDAQAYSNATNGVILFSTSAIAGGNSNNLIDNCTINATVAANAGSTAIYSAGTGTVGYENSANTISNNSIYDYINRGLDIAAAGSTAWIISGNSFYNGDVTGSINYAATSTLHGIRILGGAGYSILNNYIGGNTSLASGANAVYSSTLGNVSYQGILLTTSAAMPISNIQGNTIAAISLSCVPTGAGSGSFTGIETSGSGINIGGGSPGEGNIIGSDGANGSVIVTTSTTSTTNTSLIRGINCISTGGHLIGNQITGFDISNIGTAPASSSFQGIYINGVTAPSQVNNNIIGSATTANSIRVLPASSATTTSLYGISIGATVNSAVQVDGNMIGNIGHLSNTSSGNFTGINNTASAGAVITISNDTIQNISTAANANSGSSAYIGISGSSASFINNNTINNITLTSGGSNAQIKGIGVSGAFAHTISGNIISGLSTTSSKSTAVAETGTPAGSTITGILNSATIAGQVISDNTLYSFNATNVAGLNTVVTGIGISASASGNIFNNRVAGFTNKATGANPGILGIMAGGGSFNAYNNAIKLDNSSNTNGVSIYGIDHAAGSNWNYYYNTVSIGGNATGTVVRSAAFIRPVNGALFLINNVFVNSRTGTGSSYAISNLISPATSNWPGTASDYNDLYSSNTSTTAEWGVAGNKTFAQWQTASGGEAHSVNRPVSFFSSAYDLQPDSATNCSLNNAGIPITSPVSINTDINNASRSVVNPDMGAYEFTLSLFTVIASSNSPVCSGATVDLSVDPGTAINPIYSWKDPGSLVISTLHDPTVLSSAGAFTVTVTDVNGCRVAANTTVTLNQSPTASMSGGPVCEGSSFNLILAVTGTGTINGTLSDGTIFSGTAPSIPIPVSPAVTTAYYIADLDNAGCSAARADIPDTVVVIVTHPGDWTGAVSANWNDASNWCGGVPGSLTSANIPAGLPHYPLINTGTVAINDITIETGASLTVTGATLRIAGDISNSGIFTTANGSIEMNGSAPQTIPANAFANNSILNLVINNDVALGGQANLTGTLTVGSSNKTFATGNFLTLKSTAISTARVAQLPVDGTGAATSFITGNITVERYIPNNRAWRLLTAPLSNTGSIYDSWQNGGIYETGRGLFITGPNPGAITGLDMSTQNAFSMKTFNSATQAFYGIANTKTTSLSNNTGTADNIGYFLFVRGDRDPQNLSPGHSNATILSSTGNLQTGKQTFMASGTYGSYTIMANPYASPVDFNNVERTHVLKRFYAWDANFNKLGAYVVLDDIDGDGIFSKSNPLSQQDKNLQSGQAFFILTDTAGTSALTYYEGSKSGVSNNSVFRPLGQVISMDMILNLLEDDNSVKTADAAIAEFNNDFCSCVNIQDAAKFTNTNETFSLVRNGNSLAIERRPVINKSDTLFLRLIQSTQRNYQVVFKANNLAQPNLLAFLEDKYTGIALPVSLLDTTRYNFSINGDAASANKDRFMLVFKEAVVLPVTYSDVSARQQGNNILVSWKVENQLNIQSYEVEKSTDGRNFKMVNLQPATGPVINTGTYNWLDKNAVAGDNFYRIRNADQDGSSAYSKVVKVNIGKTSGGIVVYPNPVSGGVTELQINTMALGKYTIRLLTVIGQLLLVKEINYAGGNSTEKIIFPKGIAKGLYNLEITNPDLSKKIISLVND